MAPSTVEGRIIESLGQRLSHWTVAASAIPQAGWVITLTHPASSGLIIDTGTTVEDEAVEFGARALAASTEIDIASAAPSLAHPDLILGLRSVVKAFDWDCREVRAVAFLMFENDHLTLDETAWLSGYEGIGAPMQPRSPVGGTSGPAAG